MGRFVLEKQVATSHEYDWMVTALKGMVSAYAGKSLKQALEKVQSISYTKQGMPMMYIGQSNNVSNPNLALRPIPCL